MKLVQDLEDARRLFLKGSVTKHQLLILQVNITIDEVRFSIFIHTRVQTAAKRSRPSVLLRPF